VALENKLKMGSATKKLEFDEEDDIEEELDRDEDDMTDYLDDVEVKQIEDIREEELRKSVVQREEDRL